MRYSIPWPLLIGLAWVLAFGTSAWTRWAPASEWFVVDSVHVEDSSVGFPPAMEVQRTIKQTFAASWNVNVDQLNDRGRFVQMCAANGSGHYEPDKDLPLNLTLTWWTFPVNCAPAELGRYRVDTVWTIQLSGGLTKTVRAVSNVFSVAP